jgi:hypothetical protein
MFKHVCVGLDRVLVAIAGLPLPTNSGTPGRFQDLSRCGLQPLHFISDHSTDSHVVVAVSSTININNSNNSTTSNKNNAKQTNKFSGCGSCGGGGATFSDPHACARSVKRLVVAFRGSSTSTHWVQNLRCRS